MTREFILNTLLSYKEDPSTCATNKHGGCQYLTEDGKKCAIGKHMKIGAWQEHGGNAIVLFEKYKMEEILTDEALSQDIPINIWYEIQQYHDSVAITKTSLSMKNNIVKNLERLTNFKFPELYLDV